MTDDQTTRDTREKRPRIAVVNRKWVLLHGSIHLIAVVAAVILYGAVTRTFSAPTAVSDTVGATGVLASFITLIVVVFQIDVALRIGKAQTELADRELQILENQDREMRRLPDLRLVFTDAWVDRTTNMISTKLEFARDRLPTPINFSIENRGKSITGVAVEFWLPAELSIATNAHQRYDWRPLPIAFNSADPGPYFFGNRTDLETLRLPNGGPVELAPIFFIIKYPEVPIGTPSTDLPAPITIRYRLKAEGITWPTDAAFGELWLVAFTTYDPANPPVQFPPKPFTH